MEALQHTSDVTSVVSLETLQARLDAMAQTLDALRPVIELLHQAPAFIAMAGDSVDELVRTAVDNGIDVERGVINGAGAALRFGATMDAHKVAALESLLNSGVLDPQALRLVGDLGHALAETASGPVPAVGPLGLWKALSQPDVQRALGFMVAVAQRFGSRLGASAPAHSR
jgi:hypothetical protein